MKQFIASSNKVEVIGKAIIPIINDDCAFKNLIIESLAKNGIINVQPNIWYNQQNWLNSIREIDKRLGNSSLFTIGVNLTKSLEFPKTVLTIHDALYYINIAYHDCHRKGEIGYYKYEQLSENGGKMICTNPYPDMFDYGILFYVLTKFNKTRNVHKIIQDETKVTRNRGGSKSTYLIYC